MRPSITALLSCSSLYLRTPPPRCCQLPSETFSDAYSANLPPWLLERTAALGFNKPTTVQADSLTAVLEGRDAIIQAKTGSGKTLAYMLPLLAALKPQKSVQALVLLPTRELASQVAIVARRLAAASPERLLVMALLDGWAPNGSAMARASQVVVGNVQQVDAILKSNLLRLESLRYLVVDEVDACLADEQTKALLQRMLSGQLAIPLAQQQQAAMIARQAAAAGALGGGGGGRGGRNGKSSSSSIETGGHALDGRQTLFVSATLPQRQHFRKQCFDQRWCREPPILIHSEPEEVLPSQLRHGWAPVAQSKVVAGLRVLLRRAEPDLTAAIVFVRPSMPMHRIAEALAGVIDEGPPPLLAEDEPLPARANAVRSLRDKSIRLLLSTPLGARGLDIPHCSHVYLLGLPESAEAYTHAAGRCGRMGQPGVVTVLAGEKEEFALARLANELRIEFFDARDD